MSPTILQTLFLDNPEIPAEIEKFCKSLPEYVQAEQEYDRASRELLELVGYERYSRFEAAVTWHLSMENRAYYLFGLRLRQELLESIAG